MGWSFHSLLHRAPEIQVVVIVFDRGAEAFETHDKDDNGDAGAGKHAGRRELPC
jgi:hypothetical protein